jgi:hypothetical protein
LGFWIILITFICMKGFTCLFLAKLGLVVLVLGLGGALASCSKDEPLGHIPNHEANGGGGGNAGSGPNGSGSGANGESDSNGSNLGENDDNGGGANGGGTNGGGTNGGGTNGGGTNGSENGGSVEGEARIVGDWLRSDGKERICFGADGRFGSYSAVGDDGGWELCEEGHYVYKDLSRRVWIETFVDGEDRSAVYRTAFGDDGTLTLWSEDNRRLDYKKFIS